MISIAVESPGFESHTDILSLSFLSFLCCFYCYCETTDTANENLDLWLHHLWQTILTHGAKISLSMTIRDFSVSACLSHPRIKLMSQTVHHCYVSRVMTKPTKWHVRPAMTQISLGIHPVWSESSLSAWRKLGSIGSIPNFKFIHFSGYTITYNYMRYNTISNTLVATHWTHSDDSDQTERMPRLSGCPDWSESWLGAQSFCWFCHEATHV